MTGGKPHPYPLRPQVSPAPGDTATGKSIGPEATATFTHAFATTASCSASRSVILTGLHNHFNGQYGHTRHFHKFASFPSMKAFALPQLMAQAGYRTVDSYISRPEFEFFDLASDPNGSRNLADDPAHAATLEKYKSLLKAAQKRTGDPWILKWEYE